MASDLCIFDRYGAVDQEAIAKADLSALLPDEREALACVLEADNALKAVEQRVIDARKSYIELQRAHEAAFNAYTALVPAPTQAELVMQNISRAAKLKSVAELKQIASDLHGKAKAAAKAVEQAETDEAAAPAKAASAEATTKANAALVAFTKARDVEATKRQLDGLAEKLTAAQVEYTTASAAAKTARTAQGGAISAWIKHTKKLTTLDVAREYQARSAQAALASVQPQPEHRRWPIEDALAGKKAAERASRSPRRLA